MCLNEAYIPYGPSNYRRNAAILVEAAERMDTLRGAIFADHVRDELEQNQRWWEREYEALKQRCFPPKPKDY